MSFPQGPHRRQQSDWDALKHELADILRRLRGLEGGGPFRAAGITARDDGLLFNSRLYFTSDTGGNINPAALEAWFNGSVNRTAMRILPPYGVGQTLDDTALYLEGPSSGNPAGMALLTSGGTLLLDAEGIAHLKSNGDFAIVEGATGFSIRTSDPASSATHAIYVATADVVYRAPHRHYFFTGAGGGAGTRGIYVEGSISASGTKPFVIDHPLHEDKSLVHAATESPIAGLEYPFPEPITLDDNGEARIDLPDYFEALAADDYRAVWVQPVGRPFATGADLVVDGATTVYGEPGRQVFVRVTARRGDAAGQFDVEIPRMQPPATPEPEEAL